MNTEAPPSVAPLTQVPLTQALADRALQLASACYGVDPATAFETGRKDGRGKARVLAAVALYDPACRPMVTCARAMAISKTMMAPTQLQRRGILEAHLETVRAGLFLAPLPDSPVLTLPTDWSRGEAGWTHPARDAGFDARVVKARMAGQGPGDIAKTENCSRHRVLWALSQSGRDFPRLSPGRPAKDPADRARRKPRVQITAVPAAPQPAPSTVAHFPADHPLWAPLKGSEPVRLIDHRSGCRWPVEVEGRREPMVCNVIAVGEGPYCKHHRWLSISPSSRMGERRLKDAA